MFVFCVYFFNKACLSAVQKNIYIIRKQVGNSSTKTTGSNYSNNFFIRFCFIQVVRIENIQIGKSNFEVKNRYFKSTNVSLIDELEYEVLKKVICQKRNAFWCVVKVF